MQRLSRTAWATFVACDTRPILEPAMIFRRRSLGFDVMPAEPERPAKLHSHVEEMKSPMIGLLETSNDKLGKGLDTGTTGTTGRIDPHLEAVGKGNRADKRRR